MGVSARYDPRHAYVIDGAGVGSKQALVEPGKNLTFVGSYKLPLSQYMCTSLVGYSW